MAKTHKIDIRLDADELLEIERQARVFNMHKSQFARLLLTGGAPSLPRDQHSPPPPAGIEDSKLAEIDSRLAELEESARASARAFDALLSQLNEFLRVPSFREYRARLAADGIEKRQNEDDTAFLIRAANRYFVLYQAWPDVADSRAFGPTPAGFDTAKFPRTPPAA